MKKKELILDFTSLLDVIMILLFVVISNMNMASLSASEKAEKELSEAQTQIEELSNERDELLSQEKNYSALNSELEELQLKYETLQDEYDYLKIISNYDASDTSVYEAAIERTSKIVLICDTDINEDTGNQEVHVDIYLDSGKIGEQSYVDSVTIEHDFSLSKDERDKLNADQVIEVTKVLSGVLREIEHEIIWFSIQYAYDDENFSNSDLKIMNESINNLERSFSKVCYVEEIKIY